MIRSLLPLVVLAAAPPLGDADRTWSPERDDALFGHSVSDAGDIDMDGMGDVIVGAPLAQDGTGRVLVYDGHANEVAHDWKGENPGDHFGWSVSSAGDIDDDGFSDLVIGAPGFDGERGKVYVYDGKTSELVYELEGENAGDRFGWSVSDAGDVDIDGFDDFVIGAPGVDDRKYGEDAGMAFVISGQDAEVLHEIEPESQNEELGWSVANAGDTNIDGFGDVVVGAPGARKRKKSPATGAVRVYHGKKGKLLHTFYGEEEGDRFGHAVHTAGDADGNGAADIIVGTDTPAAYVRIIDGKKGELLYELEGEVEGSRFGWSVANAGDFDGDAYSDVVIGVPGADGIDVDPHVLVVSGKTGAVLRKRTSNDRAGRFGISVSSAGDLNADSFFEIIVGADGGGTTAGKAFVFDAKD